MQPEPRATRIAGTTLSAVDIVASPRYRWGTEQPAEIRLHNNMAPGEKEEEERSGVGCCSVLEVERERLRCSTQQGAALPDCVDDETVFTMFSMLTISINIL